MHHGIMGSSLYIIVFFFLLAVFGHGIWYCILSKTKTCTSYSGWKMIWNSQLSSKHSDVRCRRYTYQLPHQTLGAWCLVGVLHSAIGDLIDLRAGESQWFRTGLWQERHYSRSIHSASLILIIFSMLQWVCWAWLCQWHLIMPASMMQKCDTSK